MTSADKFSEPLTVEESQLIYALRQWRAGDKQCSLSIELFGGAWDISLSESVSGKILSGHGVGKNFDEAWNSVNPTSK